MTIAPPRGRPQRFTMIEAEYTRRQDAGAEIDGL